MTTPIPGPDENLWTAALRRNPEHAKGYAERWRRLEAAGKDILGEARLLDAMAERGARILDAGCGSGRLGGHLARAGHDVVGVDLDPHLIEVARAEHPGARWEVGNLAALDLRDEGGARLLFDLQVSAGNVLTFLAGAERRPALAALASHLAPQGRLVVGFGLDRGYALEDFTADAEVEGLVLVQRFSSWDLRPASDDFLVGVLEHG
ncbi:bifunctional 2-polyprenyl-6-hydroxyphenol methylase/3-demethylubiquinol 3-O-methyltransferase UbiG [Brachybacterium sp. EE-P12]|uniref:Class I SAM-dependent methyltransferase n=1 Tax=Candidatus Brachybacterium intestinipullorum TaxID=2838512 RepID=A0A9D2TH53_9MICO|nr:class I SAM-dependent methyltransferase [Brachybacterium sp. EE-P12]HJC68921.1 class I SAM-dependent methyltransferase [Candidatus Brachybacterium intestinipullorum]